MTNMKTNTPKFGRSKFAGSKFSGQTLIFGGALIAFQALDGALTSIGIQRAGIEAEANPLIRSLMVEFGDLTALAAAKVFAICLIILLINLSLKRKWIEHVLVGLAFIYFIGAIIPWSYLLFA